jgi:hypothetical protein
LEGEAKRAAQAKEYELKAEEKEEEGGEQEEERDGHAEDRAQLVLTCMATGCPNAVDEAVCGSPYCVEHEHHPVGKTSFEVVRQVLIDIRESTGYTGWTDKKEGWDKLETYTTMEELNDGGQNNRRYGEPYVKGVEGVAVKDGKLVWISLYANNLTGTT